MLIGLFAQAAEERTRILLLLDASGSMNNSWSSQSSISKMASAKKILTDLVDSLSDKPNVEIGLRIYGHLSPLGARNCQDTRLEVGFSRNSAEYIQRELRTLRPRGITPIAYSLEQAAGDFPKAGGRNIVILMTDGDESCDGDPCAVARALEEKGIVLKHFVIGIGLEGDFKKAFNCFGGLFEAKNPLSLKNALNNIVARVINETTTQVNLTNEINNQSISDIPMVFFDHYDHQPDYSFYHQLNEKGLPDTLNIDPITDYDLKIYTLPAIDKKNITIVPDRHNVIKQEMSSGLLFAKMKGKTLNNNLNNQIKCLIKKSDLSLFHVQDLNTQVEYLSGKYPVEILTLPRKKMNITISSLQKADIEIPTPGIVNIKKAYRFIGDIYLFEDKRLKKIYAIQVDAGTETVALQPGNYKLVYRIKNAESMHQTKTISFEIKSGESVELKL